MKQLLVIGGTGFFGKSILDAYRRGLLAPWNISNLILMARNTDKLLDEVPHLLGEGVEILSADIATAKTIPLADYVIHAAASTDVRDYLSKPDQEKANILAGTLNFCSLATQFLKSSKILYVSSGAVYGAQPPNLCQINEDFSVTDFKGMSDGKVDYAIAKKDAESAIKGLANDGFQVSIARCFAFVGPWLPRDQHFAIGNFIDDILKHNRIKVKAKGKVFRSYMYADDLVVWLMKICDDASAECHTYNVGSDDVWDLAVLAEALSSNYGLSISASEYRDDSVDRYVPSIEKAKVNLGLRLSHNTLNSVLETIEILKK